MKVFNQRILIKKEPDHGFLSCHERFEYFLSVMKKS